MLGGKEKMKYLSLVLICLIFTGCAARFYEEAGQTIIKRGAFNGLVSVEVDTISGKVKKMVVEDKLKMPDLSLFSLPIGK